MKIVDFSETIAASDLKVGRSSIEGQGHFLTLAQGRAHAKIKTGFSQKYCAVLNQILQESFQVQGNENLTT